MPGPQSCRSRYARVDTDSLGETMSEQPERLRQIAVTIDCNDLEIQFAFWTALLGLEGEIDEPFGFIPASEGGTCAIWLQRVSGVAAGKNRLHLDFVAGDLPAIEGRVRELGGRVLDMQQWRTFSWRTCADPEGNLFDVMQASGTE